MNFVTHMRERLGGKGTVVIVRGGPADNSIGLDRTNGFLSRMSGSSIKVVKAPGFGGWGNDGGYKVMADILVRMPKIELARVRKAGLAIDDNEMIEGMCCVAVPLREAGNVVRSGISISGPAFRYTDDYLRTIGDILITYSDGLSRYLNHRG